VSHPIFHLGEVARIGPYVSDRRMIGSVCSIRAMMLPINGEHRYGVSTPSGLYGIVLENTLRKVFERGRWSDPACVWRPKREAR
jgi:hypothetical protein